MRDYFFCLLKPGLVSQSLFFFFFSFHEHQTDGNGSKCGLAFTFGPTSLGSCLHVSSRGSAYFMVSATSQTLRIMNPTKSVFLLNVGMSHTESVGVRVGMWSDVIALRHMTGGYSVLGVDDDDSDVLLMFF